MAIGDGYNASNGEGSNNKLYDQTYYSRFSIKNGDRQLSIWYRAGLLCIELNDINQTTYKRTPIGNIFLSPIKAQMFVGEINKFKEYRNSDFSHYGTKSTNGYTPEIIRECKRGGEDIRTYLKNHSFSQKYEDGM